MSQPFRNEFAVMPMWGRYRWFESPPVRTMVASLLLAGATKARADDTPPSIPRNWPNPARLGRDQSETGERPRISEQPETPERREAEPAEPEKEAEPDGPFDPFFDLIDPARLQRDLDRLLGTRFGPRRPERVRPEVPEIGEPVFFDLTRPLGALKYSNELNYLFNSSSLSSPTLQVIEYEYTFADWNAVELDLSYYNARLEVITPFYQRTLRVGCRGRSISGIQVSPDIYLRSGFIGGSAVYAYGWQPTKESRFSLLSFVGVNRMLIGGFLTQTPTPGQAGSMLSTATTRAGHSGDVDRIYGAWRPTFNLDLFYKLNEKFTLGIENDLFFHSGKGGEYLSFPFVTWEAGQHTFFQLGGGYYHFESKDQFTFLLHLNFVNPSIRREDALKAGSAEGTRPESSTDAEADPPRAGPIRRWLGRRSRR